MTEEWFDMEGKTAHLQKGLNWLEEGMPGTEQIPYKEVKSSWWWDQKEPQHSLVATLECNHSEAQAQGTPWGSRGAGG